MVFSILLLILSYAMFCQCLSLSSTEKLWAAVLLGFSGPYVMSLGLGQLSCLLLFGLVCLLDGIKYKKWLLTVFGQSLFWFKPHLLLPILCYEVGAGLYNISLASFGLAMCGLILSITAGGYLIVPNYIHLLKLDNQLQGSSGASWIEPTLKGQLVKFSVSYDHSCQIAVLSYFALLVFSWYLGKSVKAKRLTDNILFYSVVPLSLCLALHCCSYDLLLIYPGIFAFLKTQIVSRYRKTSFMLAGALIVILLIPIYLPIHYLYILKRGIIDPFFFLVLIFAVGATIIEWKCNREQTSS